ncbi:MAG: hypothetical protein GXO39_07935 [Thermotogae bacterium]|nr:hypothetical protein [Thermotogota bacterium]
MIDSTLFLISGMALKFWAGPHSPLPIGEMFFSNPNFAMVTARKIGKRWYLQGDTLKLMPACALITKLAGYNVKAGLLGDIYRQEVLGITGENPLGKFIFDNAKRLTPTQRETLQAIPKYVPRRINRIITALLKLYLPLVSKKVKDPTAYMWDSLSIKEKKEYEAIALKDVNREAYAFQVMCLLVDSLKSALRKEGGDLKSLRVSTPWGVIAFGGPENDSFPDALIVVDAGGDDTYGDVALGVDLSGNDTYTGSVGFGRFSVSVFVDVEGDDLYEGKGMGAGFSGFGALFDLAGNDTYRTKVFALGAGYNGGGLLIDVSGNDTYYAYQKAQGFGWVKGVGILADLSGDDTYTLEDSLILFPSPQDPKHNANLGQGMGYGERRDFYDGHSLAGGIGILTDLSGNDRYYAGVFAQGVGYWWGSGVLYDGQGNDAYSGVWYVQGSAAHFALGVLFDEDGDDAYFSARSTSQGVGHDFSYGLLVDGVGNDTYTCNNLCLGSGNAQGVGIFWDKDGRLQVHLKGKGLGFSNPAVDTLSLRSSFPTKGVVCKGKSCP